MLSNNELYFNLYMPETKEVSSLITMISPYYKSSCLKKYSKFERMCGYNYSFIIEKGHSTNGWLQLETNQINIFENRDDFKCLFQIKAVP